MKLIEKIKKKIVDTTGIGNIVLNVNGTAYGKRCLMSYIKDPFLQKDDHSHQNLEQIKIIAKIMDSCGYDVDVIDYRSKNVMLKGQYEVLFEICIRKYPVYAGHLAIGAKRIAYLTGSESKYANNAEIERINDLEKRRGVRLQLRRQAPLIEKSIEDFDAVIMIGDEYNFDTYHDFNIKRHFLVPNTRYLMEYRFDIKKKRKNAFLFLGSSGCVHKGLDLLLEVFSEDKFPAELYICGNFKNESDFEKEYEKELYRTKNIHAIGFVNITSSEFSEITQKCVFSILPSCSEGRAGAVVTCMSFGLIPICSRMCGYDEDEVEILKDCSIVTIREKVLDCIAWDEEKIKNSSYRAYELVQRKYNLEEFTKEMRKALESVL